MASGGLVIRELLLLVVSLALLMGGLYLAHTKVVAIQVGEHTSRLVGTLCAIVAYYYLRRSFSLRVPDGIWTAHRTLDMARIWLPPIILFGMAGFYAITIFKNWRSEFIALITSTAWIAVVVALVLGARYVLTM
jgi:uncharacterized membrane protein YfhO